MHRSRAGCRRCGKPARQDTTHTGRRHSRRRTADRAGPLERARAGGNGPGRVAQPERDRDSARRLEDAHTDSTAHRNRFGCRAHRARRSAPAGRTSHSGSWPPRARQPPRRAGGDGVSRSGNDSGAGAHALRARGVCMRPASLHVEPRGATATARHYIRDLVYGANDGIITTFAVVSGVAGGQLSQVAVLVVGAANLAADGVSMGVGNFLAIRADERAREADGLPELERHPWKHGLATLLAFVVAGAVPLVPYVMPSLGSDRLLVSTAATFSALYLLGAARALVTRDRWWLTGLENLALGAVVAGAAYAAGRLVAAAVRL